MNAHASNSRLVSIDNAAAYLGVHPRTVRRHISSGRLAAYRVGPRTIRVDADSLEAMLRPIPSAGDAA